MFTTFNFKLMFRIFFKSLFAARHTNARLTFKRIIVLLIICPIYIMTEIINCTGFLMDDIFFRHYRNIEIKKPVFIIGNPRSGTTFLHRLLARDKENFTSMKLWEIMFAPSVTQKKIFTATGLIDRKTGGILKKCIVRAEARILGKLGRIHKTSLFEHEEDAPILLHIFSSIFLILVFPFEEDFEHLIKFDELIPSGQRTRIMAFYKRCIQCHLFVFGKNKHFLSKNPVFSPMVKSLNETFPDAVIICLVRTPFRVLPSLISLLRFYFNTFFSPIESYPMRQFVIDATLYWYRHPSRILKKLPEEYHAFIKYTELTSTPKQVILRIYEQFGFKPGGKFYRILQEEQKKAASYISSHHYNLEGTGLTREEIIETYRDVFEESGFDTES